MCGFMSGGGGGGVSARQVEEDKRQREEEARKVREEEEKRQADIALGRTKINERFAQFDDDFYNTREQSYRDYANPVLEDQLGEQLRALNVALARQGLTNSSVAAERRSQLDEDNKRAMLDIENRAVDFGQSARDKVDAARENLLAVNRSTADPNQIDARAVTQSSALTHFEPFPVLGSLLADITQGLAVQADLERRGRAAFDTGIFSNRKKSGSGRVVT